MKSMFSLIAALVLLSAGCESTSSAASTKAVKNVKNTEAEYEAPERTDYSDKDEIGDISGPMKINGTINGRGMEGFYVRLFETEGKNIFQIDSCKVKDGAFSFDLKDAKIGVYRMGRFRYKTGDFILNPEEKEITVSVSGSAFDTTLKGSNSKENDAYNLYKQAKRKHDGALKTIRQMKASTDVKLKKIYAQEETFKTKQEEMADANPNTFFAKMVRRFQSPFRFDQQKYWDDVDFTDESLIRSMALNDRIQDYMRQHGKAGKTNNDGFLDAVDYIYLKSKVNEPMMNFMLYTMMEGFYTSNMKEASNYIVDNYIHGDGCGDGEVSALIKAKADGLKSLEVGETPPDFTIADENGKMVNLRKVASDNDLTLVLFWASWCHKCEQEMPVLKRVYDAYHAQGFEIVGVSMDFTKPAWISGIKSKGCDWINVSQLEQWESPVAKDYRISSTPVMFLLDTNGKIVLRPDRAFKLENWMKANY